MKKLRILVSLLILAALLTGLGGQAFAANYHVRLYGGDSSVGALKSSHDADIAYGNQYTFDTNWVNVVDKDRYYVKGFREAGKDNSNGFYTTSCKIERDMDFVVAYGMLGSAVAYTVNYVDADNKELAPAQTFYANVGDKPIVSYIYIEDHQPQAYALTKTLTSNPGENVFTFTYTEVEPVTVPTYVVVGGVPAVVPAQPAAQPQPEEIIDLDTPLAGPGGEGEPVLGMLGDWKATDSTRMSKEATAAFEKAMEGSEGVKYEPVALLAQKEDSGTNYDAILCKAQEDKPDAQPYYAIVYVNEDKAEVLKIVNLTRNGEVDENAGADKQKKTGDWTVTEKQDPGLKAFEKAAKELTEAKCKPVYVLSSQLVSGTNYCVLAQAKNEVPEAEAFYTLATVNEDLAGNVKITEFRNLDIGELFGETAE